MSQAIENGTIAVVHYTGSFPDGEVFDSSEGKDPLAYQVGKQQMIPGFEQEMMGAAGAGAPTNNIGSGQIAGSVEAGDDPPVFPKKKRKPTPVGRYGTRRTWRQQSGKS